MKEEEGNVSVSEHLPIFLKGRQRHNSLTHSLNWERRREERGTRDKDEDEDEGGRGRKVERTLVLRLGERAIPRSLIRASTCNTEPAKGGGGKWGRRGRDGQSLNLATKWLPHRKATQVLKPA